MKGIGERFKYIRQTLNYSQSAFGEKLGLSGQGVSNIEKEKSFLGLNSLEKLLYMGVNLNYLVGGIGEMFYSEEENDSNKSFEEKVIAVLKKEGIIN